MDHGLSGFFLPSPESLYPLYLRLSLPQSFPGTGETRESHGKYRSKGFTQVPTRASNVKPCLSGSLSLHAYRIYASDTHTTHTYRYLYIYLYSSAIYRSIPVYISITTHHMLICVCVHVYVYICVRTRRKAPCVWKLYKRSRSYQAVCLLFI